MLICIEKECKYDRVITDLVGVNQHGREGHTILDQNELQERVRRNYTLLINSDQQIDDSLCQVQQLKSFLGELENKMIEVISGIKELAQANQYNDLKQFNTLYQLRLYNFSVDLLNAKESIKDQIVKDLKMLSSGLTQISWNFNEKIQKLQIVRKPENSDVLDTQVNKPYHKEAAVKFEQPQQIEKPQQSETFVKSQIIAQTPLDIIQEYTNNTNKSSFLDQSVVNDQYNQRPNKFDIKVSDKVVKFSESLCALYSPHLGYAYIKGKFQSQCNRKLIILIGSSGQKNNSSWFIEIGIVNVALFNAQEYRRQDRSNFIYTITNSGIARYPGSQEQRQFRVKQNQEVTLVYQKNELLISTSEYTEVFYVKEHIGTLLQFFISSLNINLSIK